MTDRQAEALALRGVRKSFGRTEVLGGVDLAIRRHERLALIGPNGAGKSTLFDLVSGGLAPDGGSITLAGVEIARWPAHRIHRLGLARSFQITHLFARLTVADITFDKEEYRVGDTAQVTVRAPFKGRLFFSVESGRTLSTRTLDMDSEEVT